jgi:hypothetical protein
MSFINNMINNLFLFFNYSEILLEMNINYIYITKKIMTGNELFVYEIYICHININSHLTKTCTVKPALKGSSV